MECLGGQSSAMDTVPGLHQMPLKWYGEAKAVLWPENKTDSCLKPSIPNKPCLKISTSLIDMFIGCKGVPAV